MDAHDVPGLFENQLSKSSHGVHSNGWVETQERIDMYE